MKRIILTLIIILMFVASATTVFADTIDFEVNTADSTVEIKNVSTNYSSYKVIVDKDDEEYIYNLVDTTESFPLQMGSGKYTISLLGSNDGRRFRLISKETINVKLVENAVFLSSNQTVNWNDKSETTAFAQKLTMNAKTDQEKFDAIYDYVINNISYDYALAKSLPKGYIPNADFTLADGTGICYDFAAITAAMLRSVDVPAKLIKGYSVYTPVYHAWNEVLINGKWIVVDTSTDSIFVENGVSISIEKDASDYATTKVY